MHLKTLTLKGFKSFASSTTLRLEPGITAVVGPNGSGKSNIVDALTWVMGEQGAKNLRGGSMADVIFAGAGSRPALGRAEVSLTIDNTDGALPIDYTEVTITRTLFRGGGSEYQINGSACRLLDVAELLSDTGLGRQMHVVVGQGRIDTVLSATPEERRGFIEEAAGVLKHRRRKERALRKLDSMAADLTRVTDLAAELRRRLGPLARQAAVARRARTIQIEVRDATARLLADDVVQAQALMETGQEDALALEQRRARTEEAERRARRRLDELADVEAASGRRLARATDVWEDLTGVAQSLASLADVAAERARGLSTAPAPAPRTDPEELERRAQRAAAQEAELAKAIEAARSTLDEATRARADAESTEADAEAALSALQRRQAEHRETVARVGGRLASARTRHEAAEAALAQARAAMNAAGERTRAARSALADAEPRSTADGQDHTGEQDRAAKAHQEARAALTRARTAVAAAAKAHREAVSEHATWAARRDTLALSLHAQDGTAALAAAGLDGVIGLLADHLSVERGWEAAVAALLGELTGAALARDDATALGALEHSHGQDLGAIRLLVPTEPSTKEPVDAPPCPDPPASGALAASALVASTRPGLTRLLRRLLDGAWAVADLDAAQAVRAQRPDAVVATRQGDVLGPGWVRGAGGGSSSVLELAAAHEEATARAEAAARAETAATSALKAARRREEAVRSTVSRALDDLRRADARAASRAEARARLASAARAAEDEAGRARHILERAESEAAQRTAELAAATVAVAATEQDTARAGPADMEQALAAARSRREAAEAASRQAREEETEARLALRTAEERERSGRGRADSLRAAARREREQRAAEAQAQARRARRLEVAIHVRDQARAATKAARRAVATAQAERAAIETERAQAAESAAKVRHELDRLAKEAAALTDAAHREEIARAEQRMRLEALAERALNELGLELGPLVEEYGPHMPVPEVGQDDEAPAIDAPGGPTSPPGEGAESPGEDGAGPEANGGGQEPPPAARPYVRVEQEKRLVRARRDLARLGKINPLALEEHAALEQRHQFLAAQLADLKRSRADLLTIVKEVDARVQEVFASAFQDTAREFTTVFDRLFPGGQGRLVLTDPDDMLTTGIEIEARPAGKKVKRLSLLSGGERSLAAVALLVAIFKARPSPFYVMDEVEAALDDTNLGRLLEIFTELRQTSQLIIVTHQKRTMEVADALYGITMRDGVTRAVSQRLARR